MSAAKKESPKSALAEVLEHWKSSCLDTAESVKTQDDLRTDARTFFRYLSNSTHIITDTNVVLSTKSSHEEALVKLIQDLGPAFTATHHQCRVRALHVLVGAIEGCKNHPLSNKIANLLGTFLLGHCGPIDDDEYGEDYDSMIRDAAVLGLTGLTQIATTGSTDGEILEGLKLRLDFSTKGVERRCAVPELEAIEDDYGYGNSRNVQDIRGGLSTLPRSKRSMCFDLLRSTIAGVTAITSQVTSSMTESLLPNLQTQLVEFARFAMNCIQGESDPRCLQQLLELLHAMQVALQPWFVSSEGPDQVFPTEELFDAVAQYYPIQFTPPPNNIHGITREGLQDALLAVLTFIKMDDNARKHNRHSMLSLGVGLFLEQLLPMEENPTPLEKFEALECLSALLFPKQGTSLCDKLDPPSVRNLSEALKATHDESSLGVAQGGEQGDHNKLLADTCRTFVSKVAFQLELSSNKVLWEAFVYESLQKQSSNLKLSPSSSKTSIAYMACLTASGGPRTLRSCLAMGLEPLLDYLKDNLEDSEDAAAAAHGIGAFFSSCRVAMDRAKMEGVVLHPHPLEPYTEKACQLLLDAFDSEDGKLSLPIKVGVVRALECLLLASSSDHLNAEMLARICTFIETLQGSVTNGSEPNDEENDPQYSRTCCIALGSILGDSLDTTASASDDAARCDASSTSLLLSEQIQDCVKERVYPSLLDAAIKGVEAVENERFDREALATACSFHSAVAESVVSSCLELLRESLTGKGICEASTIRSQALSYILQNGGDYALHAYHKSSTVDVILDTLSDFGRARSKAEVRSSVANLVLPTSAEEQQAFQKEIDSVNTLVDSLLPAYRKLVPRQRVTHLLKEVSNIIPPLSEADNLKLCIRLPILGVALHGIPDEEVDGDGMETDDSMEDFATSMLSGLTEFVMSSDYDTGARSAAASCLHAAITLSDAKECPVRPLVTSSLNPVVATAADIVAVKDYFNFLALMGSAAARRGATSAKTAAEIARCLVEGACTGKSLLPFSSEDRDHLDFSEFEDGNGWSSLELDAASAYGSMLSVDGVKPLMKQRLTHISLKHIKMAYEKERDQARNGETVAAPRVGLLTIVCHVVCSSDVSKIDQSTLHQMATLAVEGLSSKIFLAKTGNERGAPKATAAKNLVLAAILKIICVAPTVVNSFLFSFVTGLLRAYATSDPTSEVSTKLLALQALEGVAHMDGASQSTAAIKPAVVAVLAAAMNHPSGLLRQAAVDVRNAWYVME